MPDEIRIVAGRCRIEFTDDHDSTVSVGDVIVVCKPDNTVLVHDAAGYQPVAWLTRPAALSVAAECIDAIDGDRRLRIEVQAEVDRSSYTVRGAGHPIGTCPPCEDTLVRSGGGVECLGCGDRYTVPGDAALTDGQCGSCGLPQIRVRRGHQFTVCLDRQCESIDRLVGEAFDEEWSCPNCGDQLGVLRRGGLLLGCASYPECETSFSVPSGLLVDTCECGLPVFETSMGQRCLDTGCAG